METFKAVAGVFADINACRDFFGWVTPCILAARHQLLGEGHSVVQHRILAEREQIRHLENNIWKLQTSMPKMLDLIERVEWQSHKKPAAELLPHIKDAVYDAEDFLDEFKYYALRLKLEESKNSSEEHMHAAFLEFFKSINDCDHFNKVKEIQGNLDHIHYQSKDLRLHKAPLRFDKSIRPETSAFTEVPQIFGREKELKHLVQKLGVHTSKRGRTDDEARATELRVLPIFGMGGVGKTTIAQQICDDAKVKEHFDCIIWTCVSDDFDAKRLIKEILEQMEQDTTSDNLNNLVRKLACSVESKKLLLVLDDMWGDTLRNGGAEWDKFCIPLRNALQGSMILVTTRFYEVANLVCAGMKSYELEGLQDVVFWEFFKSCAFGSNRTCNDLELERIGKDMLQKLKGSPLAAKTVGRLLQRDLSRAHWESILTSELWMLEQDVTDILPALRLSYMYLPPLLKRCFSICALYPKDHKFDKEFLVDIWIAQGYVELQDASLAFDELVKGSFFQISAKSNYQYVIHDLMHDTAQLVSKDECFIIKHASDLDKIPSTVRHLSVFTNENVGCSELKRLCNKKKLWSLVCNESYNSAKDFSPVIDCWFKGLPRVRVLSFRLSRVRQLPESMGNSKHLRYLCLLGSPTFRTLPSSVCHLHLLKTIEAKDCVFQTFPECFSDAISLQKIKSKGFSYDKDHCNALRIQWTSDQSVQMMENQIERLPHWNLQQLRIVRYGGESCPSWLCPNLLPRLRSLRFDECMNIQCISFFEPYICDSDQADNLHHLEVLEILKCDNINWQSFVALPTSLRTIELCDFGYSTDHFVSCFRDLIVLTELEIRSSKCLSSIPLQVWSSNFPSLEKLHIVRCESLISVGVSEACSSNRVGAFTSLVVLYIFGCTKLLSLDEFLTPDYLPAVKDIWVACCDELTSLPVDRLHSFTCLQMLVIKDCPKLNTQMVLTLPSSLKNFELESCPGIEYIDNRQLGSTPALEKLKLTHCSTLRSISGSIAVAQVESVYILDCPELTEVRQPLRRGNWRNI
ncbi:putative disease resistance protein RGA1 isoform X3 [Aegilops tauschii subsp. strangulata]|nr:putative disease resistance protein RGA3 isoform X3 [Aegilops tauschii subsp. strangulata]